jgi:hypothetical protein
MINYYSYNSLVFEYNITIDEEVGLCKSTSAPIKSMYSAGRHGWNHLTSAARRSAPTTI